VSNELVPFVDMQRMAVTVAKSGLFGIRTADQALALMLVSQAEGRHPALAARDYDIIQGRPAKKAEAMMRDFLQSGGTVVWHELTDTCAKAKFSHPQGGSVTIEWDTARARRAGLEGKENYKKFPRAMLRSRVVSEGVRTVYPAATSGMYVPEEVRDIASDAAPGVTIDHAAEELDQFAAGGTTGAAPEGAPEGGAKPRDLRAEGRAASLRGVTEFRAFWGGLGDSERSGLERDLPEFERVAKSVDDDPFGLTPAPDKPVKP